MHIQTILESAFGTSLVATRYISVTSLQDFIMSSAKELTVEDIQYVVDTNPLVKWQDESSPYCNRPNRTVFIYLLSASGEGDPVPVSYRLSTNEFIWSMEAPLTETEEETVTAPGPDTTLIKQAGKALGYVVETYDPPFTNGFRFRLVHIESRRCSGWAGYTSIAMLDDVAATTGYYGGSEPTDLVPRSAADILRQFAVCYDEASTPATLEPERVYTVLELEAAVKHHNEALPETARRIASKRPAGRCSKETTDKWDKVATRLAKMYFV